MESLRNEPRLEALATEAWDPAGADLDLRSTDELVTLDERGGRDGARRRRAGPPGARRRDRRDRRAARSAAAASSTSATGTSGRLALVDAMEMRVDLRRSGRTASSRSSRARRERRHRRSTPRTTPTPERRELRALGARPDDAVVGISASGRTPYVLGALEEARLRGGADRRRRRASTARSSARSPTTRSRSSSGGEVVSGSTRLKAGTAQKLVLNMISTVAMIRLGKTFGNLMVDVVATNDKLRARVRRIVALATGAPDGDVDEALERRGRRREGRDRLPARGRRRDHAPASAWPRPTGSSGRRSGREARRRGSARRRAPRARATSRSTATGSRRSASTAPNGRGIAAPGFVDLQVNGFAGVDFLGTDADGFAAAGEALLETGVTSYLPTFITTEEGDLVEALRAVPADAPRRTHPRRPPRGAVPLPAAPRHARAGGEARPRSGAARAPARGRPRAADDAGARAAGRARADRPAPRARRDGLARAQRRDRGGGARGLRPRRAHGDPRLQRDAAARASRPGDRRRRARAARRGRPGDRRRRPPRPRDRPAPLAPRRGPARARHRRDRRRGARRRHLRARRDRDRRGRRRRAPRGRRARGQRAHDDRGGAQPRRRRTCRSSGRSRRRPRSRRASLGDPRLGRLDVGGRADLVVLDDALEVVRTIVGGETRVAG